MQAIMVVPYYLALAHGHIRLNLLIGIASIVLIPPLMIYMIMKYGIVGAGFSWLVLNLFILPLYMYFLHRRFLPGELRRWFLQGVWRPSLAALPIILLGRWLVPHTASRLLTFCMLGLVWGTSVAATATTVPELRNGFRKQTYKLFRTSYGTE